jgi:hypothetical protein
MAGYTRQSLAQILNGEIVSAPPLNAEFNQILAAFNNSTGHKHDGTAAEGPPIDRIADLDQNNLIFVDTSANQINFYIESSADAVGQISIQDGAIVPFTDNDIDLGSSSFEFKDLYIDGTANIDTLATSLIVAEAGTAGAPSITTTGDVDNGLYFNAANQMSYTSGGVAQVTFKDGSIVPVTDNDIDLGASGAEFKDLYIDGTANIDSLVADTVDINGGTIDNTVIGATTPAAATFTNLTVSTGSTINFSGATVSNGGTFTTVTISGGTITGITDLAIADGGTGASTASVARTNLGLAIGTNVQAYDAGLQSISGLTTTADQMIYTTSSDTYATASLTSAGRALLDDADASAQRTTLGLGTLATQNANSVAITGGTISGISNLSDPGTSLQYTFSTTTTDSDPGSGLVRLNNATQNAATEIYIDDEDSDGTDVSGVIGLLAGGNNPSSVLGYVTIRKEFAPENFITMKITTLTSASGYTKLVGTVEASSGASPFSDTDNLYFSIDVSGDKGDPGDISGPGSSTDNAVVRWDGTSGGLIQDSSVVIDDSGNVGIGTTSPGSILELASTGPVLTLNDTNGVVGGSQTSRISFEASGTETGTIGIASGAGFMAVNNKSGSLALLADSNNTSASSTMTFSVDGSEAARIDSSGRFLLGTTSGSNLLTVAGTASISGALTASGGGALTGTWSDLGTVTTIDINGGTIDGVVIGGASAAAATVTTLSAGGAAVSPGVITAIGAAGEVAAGNTTGSLATFSNAGNAAISLHGAATSSATVYFGTTGADGNTIGRLVYDFSANAMAFFTGNTERARIDSSGRFLLGTTSGSNLLTVAGTASISGALTASGGGSLTGTWSDLGTVTTMDLNGGTADNVVIGGAVAAAGTFTTISVGGAAVSPGVITAIGAAGEVAAGNTTGSLATFSNAGAAAISLHGAAANSATVYFGTTGADGNTIGRLVYDFSANAMAFFTGNNERARFVGTDFLIGTTTAGASKLVVADDSIQINTAKTPASAAATGTTGEFAWDASYFYICTATNTWRRVAHATW